jgi:hypothetical protein
MRVFQFSTFFSISFRYRTILSSIDEMAERVSEWVSEWEKEKKMILLFRDFLRSNAQTCDGSISQMLYSLWVLCFIINHTLSLWDFSHTFCLIFLSFQLLRWNLCRFLCFHHNDASWIKMFLALSFFLFLSVYKWH